MTRLEAVSENVESMENEFKSNNFIEESQESKALILEASKLSTLVDISVTLAMIADALDKEMSEYVKIKRRLYDELIETQAKYTVLCNMLESMTKVYNENKIKAESEDKNEN